MTIPILKCKTLQVPSIQDKEYSTCTSRNTPTQTERDRWQTQGKLEEVFAFPEFSSGEAD